MAEVSRKSTLRDLYSYLCDAQNQSLFQLYYFEAKSRPNGVTFKNNIYNVFCYILKTVIFYNVNKCNCDI